MLLIKIYKELIFQERNILTQTQGANESVEDFIDRVINSGEELEVAYRTILEYAVILTI